MFDKVAKMKILGILSYLSIMICISYYLNSNMNDVRFWVFLLASSTALPQTINFFQGKDMGAFGPGIIGSDADKSDRTTYIVLFDIAQLFVLYFFVDLFWLS